MTKQEIVKQLELQIKLYSRLIRNDKVIDIDVPYERLKDAIYTVTGINPEVLGMRTRKKEIVQARQLFYYFMKDDTDLSLESIGDEVGGYTHATVLHGIKTINNLSENNKQINHYISEIYRII